MQEKRRRRVCVREREGGVRYHFVSVGSDDGKKIGRRGKKRRENKENNKRERKEDHHQEKNLQR